MKKLIVLPFLCLVTILWSQQNDFQYKGELPKEEFLLLNTEEPDFNAESADKIKLRNRVYLMVDSTYTELTLNGHLILFEDLKPNLTYVLINPDGHKHLPKSFQDAVIFTNIMSLNYPVTTLDEVTQFKIRLLLAELTTVYFEETNRQLNEKLQTRWEILKQDDVAALETVQIKIAMLDDVDMEEGIRVKLPPWSEEVDEEQLEPIKIKQRNLLRVTINADNQIFVRDEMIDAENLKDFVKDFITNPNDDENLAESPQQALISLKNDKGTHYEFYLTVYNELKSAYNEIWDKAAIERYGTQYENLNTDIQKEIRSDFPMAISESEPSGF